MQPIRHSVALPWPRDFDASSERTGRACSWQRSRALRSDWAGILESVRDINIGTANTTYWGATTDELVLLDGYELRARIDETQFSEHGFGRFISTKNQLFELGGRLAVVNIDRDNTTFQVEQCGN